MKDKGINLMYYDFANQQFIKSNGFGTDLSVTRNGEPIIVLENGEIVLKKGRELQKINGFARDISVTKSDDLWIISENKVLGGFEVYKGYLGQEVIWEDMNIGALRIAAYDDKTAIVVNEWGELYRYRK